MQTALITITHRPSMKHRYIQGVAMLENISMLVPMAAFPIKTSQMATLNQFTNLLINKNNMQTALLAFQNEFNASGFRKYDLTPPQVFMDAYKKANTTYIEKCAQTISEKYAIPSDLFDFVKTCVYLANRRTDEQKQKDAELELARQGFCFVIADWLKANPEAKKADIIIQNSDISQMLGGGASRIVSGCRIVWAGEVAYFLPPRKRNRGYNSCNVMAVRLA